MNEQEKQAYDEIVDGLRAELHELRKETLDLYGQVQKLVLGNEDLRARIRAVAGILNTVRQKMSGGILTAFYQQRLQAIAALLDCVEEKK